MNSACTPDASWVLDSIVRQDFKEFSRAKWMKELKKKIWKGKKNNEIKWIDKEKKITVITKLYT